MKPFRYPNRQWEYFVNDGGVCAVCDKPLRPGAGAVRQGGRVIHALCWLTEQETTRHVEHAKAR
jgi:hypothetical protein